MEVKLKERISKELIKNGIENGTINLSKQMNGQLIASIGDYWFYYENGKYASIEDLACECLYYRAVLLENKC